MEMLADAVAGREIAQHPGTNRHLARHFGIECQMKLAGDHLHHFQFVRFDEFVAP